MRCGDIWRTDKAQLKTNKHELFLNKSLSGTEPKDYLKRGTEPKDCLKNGTEPKDCLKSGWNRAYRLPKEWNRA